MLSTTASSRAYKINVAWNNYITGRLFPFQSRFIFLRIIRSNTTTNTNQFRTQTPSYVRTESKPSGPILRYILLWALYVETCLYATVIPNSHIVKCKSRKIPFWKLFFALYAMRAHEAQRVYIEYRSENQYQLESHQNSISQSCT